MSTQPDKAELGTLMFLSSGEYYGLGIWACDDLRSLRLAGVATSFVHTRRVGLTLAGDLIGIVHRERAPMTEALGLVWELDGHVDGLVAFPFLECEAVALTGTPGALIRVMSEYGEQRCLYLTGCASPADVAWLAVCAVLAAALPDPAWHPPAGEPARYAADAKLTIAGQDEPAVAGRLEAAWLPTSDEPSLVMA